MLTIRSRIDGKAKTYFFLLRHYIMQFYRRHEKRLNVKSPSVDKHSKSSKIGLRVVLTAHRWRQVIENIVLDKVVRFG